VAAYAVFGALQLGALVRFAEHVRWGAAGWTYTLVAVSVLAAGLYGWAAADRVARQDREDARDTVRHTDR
jgi:hypothetical protein